MFIIYQFSSHISGYHTPLGIHLRRYKLKLEIQCKKYVEKNQIYGYVFVELVTDLINKYKYSKNCRAKTVATHYKV